MRTAASHRHDLRRMFRFTPMAEIHQYARNISQPITMMEASRIFCFFYPPIGR
jgi:hypothetical protein